MSADPPRQEYQSTRQWIASRVSQRIGFDRAPGWVIWVFAVGYQLALVTVVAVVIAGVFSLVSDGGFWPVVLGVAAVGVVGFGIVWVRFAGTYRRFGRPPAPGGSPPRGGSREPRSPHRPRLSGGATAEIDDSTEHPL